MEVGAKPALLGLPYSSTAELDERGRLRVGECDVIELAERFGTPLYMVDVRSLRERARRYLDAFRSRHERSQVLFASKSFTATPVYRLLASAGLGCEVASGGELFLALRGGFAPAALYLHGNAKDDREIRAALEAGVGHVVIDNFDDIERLERLCTTTQRVLLRIVPGVRPDTHPHVATGQSEAKFGLPLDDARRAIDLLGRSERLELRGLHVHIGSQVLELRPFEEAIEAIAPLGAFPVYNVGGGLGVVYRRGQDAPSIEEYADITVSAVRRHLGSDVELLVEPGRSLVANSCLTAYRVVTVKRGALTHVAVDGGMSDNPEPSGYDTRIEAQIADRFDGEEVCQVVGKHCESGDVLVADCPLDRPSVGDVLVTPATGAYAYSVASNYNAVPRPPVVFVEDGSAALVVRRETYEDLVVRDC
jgi:diaminopimelate decarboxylase